MISSHSAILRGSSAYWLRTNWSICRAFSSSPSSAISFAARKHPSFVRLRVTSRLWRAMSTFIWSNASEGFSVNGCFLRKSGGVSSPAGFVSLIMSLRDFVIGAGTRLALSRFKFPIANAPLFIAKLRLKNHTNHLVCPVFEGAG